MRYPLGKVAPTAHDDQGTAATNPDFDHILRGTVHDPTTRRMGGVAGHAGVFSTAADMAKFAQALLDKLTKNTGPFPLTQATLKLATSPNEPATAVSTATIFTQDGQTTKGVASRGLGWDLNTAFSRPRGSIFPITTREHPGSFGHTGFTGTSVWIDPTSGTYVILLANAIHPKVGAAISALRGQVATAAAQALGLSSPALETRHSERSAAESKNPDEARIASGVRRLSPVETKGNLCNIPYVICDSLGAPSRERDTSSAHLQQMKAELKASDKQWVDQEVSGGLITDSELQAYAASKNRTQTGIDVLESTHFEALKALAAKHNDHLRLGLLTNQASLDSTGRRTIDILAHAAPELELHTLFAPEHGIFAHQDTDHLAAEQDLVTHIPVISVYGPKSSDKRPKQEDLKQLDAVVVDLQDAGTRFWTYETLTGYFLEACAKAKIPLIILDRPNPIGGVAVQGPTSDPGAENYNNFMPLPLRHGLTLGELARYFNAKASEVDLNPVLLDARATHIGDDTADTREQPPATQPGLHAEVIVVPMQNWSRSEYWADTGLPWFPPSPNLKSAAANVLYPGVGLTEQTNISVGRGTDAPFENLGAPWIDAKELAAYLTARSIRGIEIAARQMTIAEDANHYPYHGKTIPAIHFRVTDPAAFDSPEFGVELLSALRHLYPAQFKLELAKNLMVNAETLAAVKAGKDPREIAASWAGALHQFEQARNPFLLY